MQLTSSKNIFSNSFLFGLFLLAAALPYSKFMISLALIILLLSWLGEGRLKEKFTAFFNNKTALILSSLFLLHIVGLLYTSDFKYGMEDINKKLPLFLFPLFFSTCAPLSKKMFDRLLALFTLSVVVATLICFVILLGYTSKQILHPQEASVFISHIRFGLLISMAVFILGYFLNESNSLAQKALFLLLIIWLIAFLIMLESATGLVCSVAGLILLAVRNIFSTNDLKIKIALASVLILAGYFAASMYRTVASGFEHRSEPVGTFLSETKAGNPYTHDTLNTDIENGNYIWRNVCETELKETWNSKSKLDYSGKDLRGNDLKFTLIRFLTSKGLTKDAEGVNSLSPEELKAIEKGVANINYMGVFNPTARLQKIVWEFNSYVKGGNPSGHSVTQRLEFWKAALGIIKENPLFGVGTGDVRIAFEEQYEKIKSPLTKEWRLRSHNQFLAIGTAFGFLGLLLFVFTLLYPLFKDRNFNNYLYLMFFVIAFLSMFTEDTLENQNGVTFFAFFNSLFLFLYTKKQTEIQK